MAKALRESGRDIVLSICEWGNNHPERWGPAVGHLWRNTGDIYDAWQGRRDWSSGMLDILDLQVDAWRHSGPNRWNDPDMLEVGNGGMTTTEYESHFSLWAMLAAPLIAGNDLSAMSADTRRILANRDVIAIDQDALGQAARRLWKDGDQEIWARPLAGGDVAVVLFNRGALPVPMRVTWAQLNLPPAQKATVNRSVEPSSHAGCARRHRRPRRTAWRPDAAHHSLDHVMNPFSNILRASLMAGLLASVLPAEAAGVAPRDIVLDTARATAPIDRFFDLCVGSDFPGTLIRDDSQAQLKTTVDELGFRYLRFHAIFHDVLGTVRRVDGRVVHDFTLIDKLYDGLLARRIRPFVELGFTPEALATSKQTIFYWKGNTSHPDPAGWHDLVDDFVRHLESRSGAEEVRRWYFEVWNEPNLAGFWEGADQAAYFSLYNATARAIKAIDPALRVGGPSTAGADWVEPFLAQAHANGVPVDFVSTHSYGVDGGFLDERGVADTKLSLARFHRRRRTPRARADRAGCARAPFAEEQRQLRERGRGDLLAHAANVADDGIGRRRELGVGHASFVDSGFLDERGVAKTPSSRLRPIPSSATFARVRQQIAASAFPELPLFFSEWSTSYNPRDLVHDFLRERALDPHQAARQPGHGPGDELLGLQRPVRGARAADGHLPWRLRPAHARRHPQARVLRLQVPPRAAGPGDRQRRRTHAGRDGRHDHRGARLGLAATGAGLVQPVVLLRQAATGFGPARPLHLQWRHLKPGTYTLRVHRTGYRANDAFTAWLLMGSPANPDAGQLRELQALTTDVPEVDRSVRVDATGLVRWTVPMRSNDVVLATLERQAGGH